MSPPAVPEAHPLTPPVFHILLALSDADRHGYAIIQEVERRTGGRVRLGSGTLYAAIKRLLNGGLIEETQTRPAPKDDDQRRRYYAITPLGRRVAQAEAQRLEELVEMAARKNLLPRPAAAPGGKTSS